MDGIFNIHKSTGMTSHDVVARIRKLLKQKRVGHAGTLDPAASGVLPICVGLGTRVAEYLSESGKAYQAEIVFGSITDTYDAEGTVVCTSPVPDTSHARIEEIMQRFLGPQMQIPPRYSAIKLQGQPAYKRARAGEDLPMEPRPIVIYQLHVSDWHSPRLILEVECSKGTYIRSLAYDLGVQLGCGAYLAGLIRTRSGPFSLSESISLEQLAVAIASDTTGDLLFPADYVLQHYPAIQLDEAETKRVLHGNAFDAQLQGAELHEGNSRARVYDNLGRFLAIAEWDRVQQHWQPHKVFAVAM